MASRDGERETENAPFEDLEETDEVVGQEIRSRDGVVDDDRRRERKRGEQALCWWVATHGSGAVWP
jgi:hypothetical protein